MAHTSISPIIYSDIKMNKTEQLLIRACRSLNPKLRLMSVYRRFYNSNIPPKDFEYYLCRILLNIVEKYNTIKISTLISELNPNSVYTWGDDGKILPYNERVYKVLISSIRLANINKFKGLTPPLRFRRKTNTH